MKTLCLHSKEETGIQHAQLQLRMVRRIRIEIKQKAGGRGRREKGSPLTRGGGGQRGHTWAETRVMEDLGRGSQAEGRPGARVLRQNALRVWRAAEEARVQQQASRRAVTTGGSLSILSPQTHFGSESVFSFADQELQTYFVHALKVKLLSHVRLFVTPYSPWNSPGKNTGVGSLSLL